MIWAFVRLFICSGRVWISDWLPALVREFIVYQLRTLEFLIGFGSLLGCLFAQNAFGFFIGFWPVLESLIIMLGTHWLSVWPQAKDSVCFLRESLVRFQLSPCKSLGRTQHLIILAPYSECFIYRGVFTWVRCVVSEPSRSLAGGHVELVSVGFGLFFTYISWGGFNFLIGLRSLSKPSFVQNELRTWSASGLRQSRIRLQSLFGLWHLTNVYCQCWVRVIIDGLRTSFYFTYIFMLSSVGFYC